METKEKLPIRKNLIFLRTNIGFLGVPSEIQGGSIGKATLSQGKLSVVVGKHIFCSEGSSRSKKIPRKINRDFSLHATPQYLDKTASHWLNCKESLILKKGFLRKSIGKPFLSTKIALKTALKGNQ